MEEIIRIEASVREASGRSQVKDLRSKGMLPVVAYGHGKETRSLQVNTVAFEKALSVAGESTIVDLDVDGQVSKALIHSVQRDPVSYRVIHADLFEVNMNEEITAEIPLVFEGVAPAEKSMGGTLVKNLDHVTVTCLPANLPHDISVDISSLATFDDIIRVSDITIPEGVTIEHELDQTVALVSAPRSAEELEALNEDVVEDVASVEGVEKEEAAGEDSDEKSEE